MENKKEYPDSDTREGASIPKNQILREEKVDYQTHLSNEILKNYIKDNVHRPKVSNDFIQSIKDKLNY